MLRYKRIIGGVKMIQDIIDLKEDYVVLNPRAFEAICSEQQATTIAGWSGKDSACSKEIFERILHGSALALIFFNEGREELRAIACWQITEDNGRILSVDIYVSDEFSEPYKEYLREILMVSVRRQFGLFCPVMVFFSSVNIEEA